MASLREIRQPSGWFLIHMLPVYWRKLLGEVRRIPLPRTWVNRDQRAIERAVRMADTVSSGASNGTKCPAPGTNRKSRLGNVSSIPSAQDAGFTGSSSPHLLTTVGMLIGPSGAWANGR